MVTRSTELAGPGAITGYDKRGEPFQVRLLEPSDREDLQRFYEGFEPKRDAQGLPPSHPTRIRRWLASILDTGLHLLATRDGILIAHAFVVPTNDPGIGEYAVFLREDIRGRGIGTALNRIAADTAERAGWRGLWLTVEPRNRAAVRSYENAGFRFVPGTTYSLEAEMRRGPGKSE